MNNSESQDLLKRAALLTFGIFGTLGNGERTEHEVRGGGSGIFIAPSLALIARHVASDLYNLGDQGEPPRRLHLSRHAAHLVQPLYSLRQTDGPPPLWHVDRSCSSRDTDVTLIQVSPENDVAKSMPMEMPSSFFEWRLSPPQIGSKVHAIGFPALMLYPEEEGSGVRGSGWVQLHEFTVVNHFHRGRDRGMLNFPCFEVDSQVDHGFSGGPVFFEDRLCGMVSAGSSFDERSYVVPLWPLTLMRYRTELGAQVRFRDLFDQGDLKASDWQTVSSRISSDRNAFEDLVLYFESR